MPFVGLVEEFDTSMLMFGRFLSQYFNFPDDVKFNLFYCRSQNSYISSYRKELRSDTKELESYVQLDNQIFEFAVVKFNQQKKAYGDDFEKDLETFQTKQKNFDSSCCGSVTIKRAWC